MEQLNGFRFNIFWEITDNLDNLLGQIITLIQCGRSPVVRQMSTNPRVSGSIAGYMLKQ